MVDKAQLVLELTVPAYFTALNATVSGLENGVLNPNSFPSLEQAQNFLMRYICGYPHLLRINKFYPRDYQTNDAIKAFELIRGDTSIQFSEREYQERLSYANGLLLTNQGAQIWIPVSLGLENALVQMSQGGLFLHGKWRGDLMLKQPLSYFTQFAVIINSLFVENNNRLPNSPNELAMLISRLMNS